MHEFFAGLEYAGKPFQLFGAPHLSALGIIVILNLSLVFFRHSTSAPLRSWIRYGLAMILLVNETLYHAWRWTTGQWTLQLMLPLHLCAVMVYMSALMLLTKKEILYHYLYFLGIGAAIQALLTPDIGIWGFPHFRFFQSIIAHAAIVTAAMYMTLVEHYRPHFKDIGKIIIGMNIYMGFVQCVNMIVGGNYLWIARKPDFSSVIDYLGPWPWYILSLELVGIVTCLVLYIPFAIIDWRKKASAGT
jgi:hypothetical integral membrane protein (TIGR02206 family)